MAAPLWQRPSLRSAPARLPCLLRARLAALGSSALPGRGRPITRLAATGRAACKAADLPVLAHPGMGALGAEPHLNTCFKHYMYFVYEFNLIPRKEELAPLQASPPTAQPPPPPRRDRHDPIPHPNPNPNATTVTGSDRQADGRRRASVWRRRLGARRARRSRQRGGRVRHRRRTDGSVTQPHPCFPTMRSMREATTADAALRRHAI